MCIGTGKRYSFFHSTPILRTQRNLCQAQAGGLTLFQAQSIRGIGFEQQTFGFGAVAGGKLAQAQVIAQPVVSRVLL